MVRSTARASRFTSRRFSYQPRSKATSSSWTISAATGQTVRAEIFARLEPHRSRSLPSSSICCAKPPPDLSTLSGLQSVRCSQPSRQRHAPTLRKRRIRLTLNSSRSRAPPTLLFCQYQQGVAPEQPNGHIRVEREHHSPGDSHDAARQSLIGQFQTAGSVAVIDDGISAVLEGRERGLLEEIMQVTDVAPKLRDGPRPEHRLRGQVQRNVKDLVCSEFSEFLDERYVVLDVLDDIDGKNHIEMQTALAQHILEIEFRTLRYFLLGPIERLGRDLIAGQRSRRKSLLQRQKDIACAAADLAYFIGRYLVSLDHPLDMAGLPGRIFLMPCRVFLGVKIALVHFLHSRVLSALCRIILRSDSANCEYNTRLS